MPNQPAHSLEQVVAAVEAGHTIAGAARNLHVTRRTMYRYAKKWKAVQEAIEDEREDMLDYAESALKLKVLAGEAWAVTFALRTLGRSRGYAEKLEVDQNTTGKLTIEVVRVPGRPKGED